MASADGTEEIGTNESSDNSETIDDELPLATTLLPDLDSSSVNPVPTASHLAELEEEFTCAVCFDLIVLPTTLNCGHTFCRHCLAVWVDVGTRIECPSCREKFSGLPQENIQIKASMQKLFSEKYECRKQEVLDDKENRKAIAEFEKILKQRREDDELTTASYGCLLGIAIAFAVIACYYMVFHFQIGGDSSGEFGNKPMKTWTVDDVSYWLEYLELHSYKSMFIDKKVTGSRLSELKRSDLASQFYMHNPDHQDLLLNALNRTNLHEAQRPVDVWGFKATHDGYASFLLYSMNRTPRLGLLYLYRYDREGYDFYMKTVLNCNSNVNETSDSWWFYAGTAIAPYIIHVKFISCFTDLHYWMSRCLVVQYVCRSLLDFIVIGQSFRAPRNFSVFDILTGPFITMALFYAVSYIWWLVPTLVSDALFYLEIYFAPIYYLRQLFCQLRPD